MTIHDIATPLSLPKVHTIQNVGESGGKWGQSGGWWEWTFVPILRRDTSHPDPLQALRDIMRQQVQVILWRSSGVFRLLYA